MAGKPKLTEQQVLDAVAKTKGMLTITARELGVTYDTVRAYMERYPSVKEAVKVAKETMLDTAELKLYNKAVVEDDTTALIFLLKTQGKSRGYTERTELTGAEGGTLTIKVINGDEYD